MKLVKNDDVIIIAGNDKGKTGKIKRVLVKENKVIVEGVNMITKHLKPSQKNPEGGRIQKEAPIHVSNVALIDPVDKKATRIKIEKDGDKKIRVSKRSGKEIKKNLV